jgi:predicted MFS family arabinose efflux permease
VPRRHRQGRSSPRITGTPGVTGLMIVVTTIGVLPVWLTGGLSVVMRDDLRFDDQQLGFAVAGFFLASALTSLPGGHVADRVGDRTAIVTAMGATSLTLIALGTMVGSGRAMSAVLLAAGASNGWLYPAVNLAIARRVEEGRGLAFGLKQAAIPTATLLAGAALPIVGGSLGWRSAFLAAAIAAVAAGLVTARGLRPTRSPSTKRDRVRHRPSRSLLLITLAATLGAAAGNAMAAFLVPSAVAAGLTPGMAGIVLVVASSCCIMTRIAVGWMADRRDGGHLHTVAMMMGTGAVSFAALAWTGAPIPVIIGASVAAFAGGWGWAGLLNFTVVERNVTNPAAATGVLQFGVFGGAVFGPSVFGTLVVRSSYGAAWAVLAGAALAAALLLLLVDRRAGDPRRRTPLGEKEASGNGA